MQTLLLTRPQKSAEDFAIAAAWAGKVVISPLIEVALRKIAPPVVGEGIIFTSRHGVRALAEATTARTWPVWCVGPGTAAQARAAGFVDPQSGAGTARALIAQLCAKPPGLPLVHVRGAHVVTDLAGRLSAAGLSVRSVVAYDQHERMLTDAACLCLQEPGCVIVPVFSPRSARIFAAQWLRLEGAQADLYAVAISDAAARGLQDLSLTGLEVAQTPDQPGMLAALARVQAALEPDRNPR